MVAWQTIIRCNSRLIANWGSYRVKSSGAFFAETRLELNTLLRDLCDCGILTEEDSAHLSANQSTRVHPLVLIAEKRFSHGLKPGQMSRHG